MSCGGWDIWNMGEMKTCFKYQKIILFWLGLPNIALSLSTKTKYLTKKIYPKDMSVSLLHLGGKQEVMEKIQKALLEFTNLIKSRWFPMLHKEKMMMSTNILFHWKKNFFSLWVFPIR